MSICMHTDVKTGRICTDCDKQYDALTAELESLYALVPELKALKELVVELINHDKRRYGPWTRSMRERAAKLVKEK